MTFHALIDLLGCLTLAAIIIGVLVVAIVGWRILWALVDVYRS